MLRTLERHHAGNKECDLSKSTQARKFLGDTWIQGGLWHGCGQNLSLWAESFYNEFTAMQQQWTGAGASHWRSRAHSFWTPNGHGLVLHGNFCCFQCTENNCRYYVGSFSACALWCLHEQSPVCNVCPRITRSNPFKPWFQLQVLRCTSALCRYPLHENTMVPWLTRLQLQPQLGQQTPSWTQQAMESNNTKKKRVLQVSCMYTKHLPCIQNKLGSRNLESMNCLILFFQFGDKKLITLCSNTHRESNKYSDWNRFSAQFISKFTYATEK